MKQEKKIPDANEKKSEIRENEERRKMSKREKRERKSNGGERWRTVKRKQR